MRSKFLLFLSISLLLSYWAVKPLFTSGFFPIHDNTQVARVYEMAKALSSGQFPVRWVPDLGYGYGYPLFNFYAPLPYYIGGLINLMGVDALLATKMMFFFGIVLSGLTMFILASELAGPFAGVAAGMLYLYAPYHAVNIYVRGAVGEFYAFAFLPLILLATYKITSKKQAERGKFTIDKDTVLGGIGFAGVLLSHNVLGMLTTFLLALSISLSFLYTIVRRKSLSPVYNFLLLFLFGIGLSAFFIFPALAESSYTSVQTLTTGGSDFRSHFVFANQLWNSPWGYGGSAPGRADGMSFKIGKLHLVLGLLAIMLLPLLWRGKKINRVLFVYFTALAGLLFLSVFLMLHSSQPIWEILPMFPYIQYPWRLLNFSILSLSALVVILFISLRSQLGQLLLAVTLSVFTLWLNSKYFVPQTIYSVQAADYISSETLNYETSKISDEYLPKEFTRPISAGEIPKLPLTSDQSIVVEKVIADTPTEKRYQIKSTAAKLVVTHISYFPGWEVYTGEGLRIGSRNSEGKLAFYSFPADYQVVVKLTDTPVRIIGNIISFFSLFLLVYIALLSRKHLLWQKRNPSK